MAALFQSLHPVVFILELKYRIMGVIIAVPKSYILNHKYLITLILLLVLVLLYPLNFDSRYFICLMHAFFVIFLSFVCYHILPKLLIFSIILILGLASSIGAFVAIFSNNEAVFFTRYTLMLLFYFSTIIILLNNITKSKVINNDLLLGSLCVYILIALLFGSIFTHIEHYYPHSFELSDINISSLKSSKEIVFNFVYFSFTTLCTVGFGDILPISIFAKAVVIIEEITGIFYLALLVSRLSNAVTARDTK